MKSLGLLAVPLALVPMNTRAEASNYCVWMILVEAHAIVDRCGRPLDAAWELRYRQVRQAAEDEIIRDASRRPGLTPEKAKSTMSGFVEQIMNRYTRHPVYCSSHDLPGAYVMLESLTGAASAPKVLAGLERRKDPFEGDCL